MIGSGSESSPGLWLARKLSFGPGRDGVAARSRLILAHVRQQNAVIDVARCIQPTRRNTFDATGVVDIQPIGRLQSDRFEPNVFGVWNAAGSDQDFIGFYARAAESNLHRSAGPPTFNARHIGGSMHCDSKFGKLGGDFLAHKRLHALQKACATIEYGNFLRAQ